MAKTRVSIVAGFLGSGKTSVIRELLRQQQPHERVAVLVNEIGDVGIDGDFIQEVSGAECEIREMAGGCICCTAQVPFRQAVVALLRHKPDRLLVEPTGVAAVTSVREVFREPGIAPVVELDPIVVLMDPRQWDDPRIRQHPLYIEQCEAADVVAVSHLDCCDEQLIQRFQQAHGDKPLTMARFGVLDADWDHLAQPRQRSQPQVKATSKGIIKRVFTWDDDQLVNLQQLQEAWTETNPPSTLIRCKGIIQTNHGGYSIQSDGDQLMGEPMAKSSASSIVCILLESNEVQTWWERLQHRLRELGITEETPRVSF